MTIPLNLHKDEVYTLLKADAHELRLQHIDDAGFTLRTMDLLPQKKRLSAALRFAIPFGCTLIACIIAVTFTAAGSVFFDACMDLVTETLTPTVIGMAAMLVTLYSVCIGGVLGDD